MEAQLLDSDSDDEGLTVKAKKAGCEAVYIKSEDGSEGPGYWHFSQKYGEGIPWKRIKWPWVALKSQKIEENTTHNNFSRHFASAEAFLKDQCPDALIPSSLLKETLKESQILSQTTIAAYQGDLLGAGVAGYHRSTGRKRLFIAFPSGSFGLQISVAFVNLPNADEETEDGGKSAKLTAISTHPTPFMGQIQQIVFAQTLSSDDPNSIFAVRTMNEVKVFKCSKPGASRATFEGCVDLPLPYHNTTFPGQIADATFDPSGKRIAVVTTRGNWTVFEFKLKNQQSAILSMGSVELSLLETERRTGWWNLLWIDDNNTLLAAESKALYILDLDTGKSTMVLQADKKQHFCGLALLDGLGGTAIAALTTSDILIIDTVEWEVLLRQKHRRDSDSSLMLKTLSLDDVTTIFVYSRLNALITCHQISEELPLSWLDTPFQLPLPRHNPALPPSMPTLGLVIIPSQILSAVEDIELSDEASFTTFRLQPDLSIIGDMYGTEDCQLPEPDQDTTRNQSATRISLEEELEEKDEEEWIPHRTNLVFDFSDVAKSLFPKLKGSTSFSRHQIRDMKDRLTADMENSESRTKTLYELKSAEMSEMDPDLLLSNVEQVVHTLEEKNYETRHLHTSILEAEHDPEDDPGSVSFIYNELISSLPKEGVGSKIFKSKEQAIKEIATDVGLANIAIVRPFTASEPPSSLDALRKFIDMDPLVEISESAKFVLSKWGQVPPSEQPKQVTPMKRKRVKIYGSQQINPLSQDSMGDIMSSHEDGIAQITMSQPAPGRHGTRVLRKRPRKSGF